MNCALCLLHSEKNNGFVKYNQRQTSWRQTRPCLFGQQKFGTGFRFDSVSISARTTITYQSGASGNLPSTCKRRMREANHWPYSLAQVLLFATLGRAANCMHRCSEQKLIDGMQLSGDNHKTGLIVFDWELHLWVLVLYRIKSALALTRYPFMPYLYKCACPASIQGVEGEEQGVKSSQVSK